MNYFLLNIGLALVWGALTGLFSPTNLAIGFGLGFMTLWAARRALGPSAYFGRMRLAIEFVLFFLAQLVLSNVRVALEVLIPRHRMQARVLAIPLDVRTDLQITTLANLISLSPGTLSLEVSADRRTLYIHAMHAADAEAARREIKNGLERRVLALWADK